MMTEEEKAIVRLEAEISQLREVIEIKNNAFIEIEARAGGFLANRDMQRIARIARIAKSA